MYNRKSYLFYAALRTLKWRILFKERSCFLNNYTTFGKESKQMSVKLVPFFKIMKTHE